MDQLQQALSTGVADDEVLVRCAIQLTTLDYIVDLTHLSRLWTALDSAAGKGSAN